MGIIDSRRGPCDTPGLETSPVRAKGIKATRDARSPLQLLAFSGAVTGTNVPETTRSFLAGTSPG